MSEDVETTARIVLPGSGATGARIRVTRQSASARALGATLILAVALALMPVLVLVPPHFLWPLASLVAGAYAALRVWRGAYAVVEFEGRCPRCDAALEIAEGARIRARHALQCYGCHRQPELVLDEPV